jgi:hypothetical protein
MKTRTIARHITALTSLAAMLAAAGCSVASKDDTASSASDLVVGPPIPVTIVGWNGAWDDTGASDTADVTPLATSWGANRLDLFLRSGTSLTQRTWTGSTWSAAPAIPIADGLASDPAGIGWGGGFIDLVWRDAQNSLEHIHYDSYFKAWEAENLAGTFSGRPSIVIASDGTRGDVFVRVGTGVWHRSWVYVLNDWGPWEPLSIQVADDPVAVSDTPGKIELFYRASNGAINWMMWNGNATGTAHKESLEGATWTQEPTLSGYLEGAVAVAASGPGLIEVMGVGGDSGVWTDTTTNTGATWSGWSELNGCSRTTQLALTSWAPGREDVFAASTDTGDVLHKFYGANPSLAGGLTPVCCSHDAQGLDATSGPTSITGTFTNEDNTDVTVTATNTANAADTHSVVLSGSGKQTFTIRGLSPATNYLLAARTGGGNSSCGPTSEGTIGTQAASKVIDVSGSSAVNGGGTLSFNAQVTVMYTGEVTWSVTMNHNGSYDLSYDLQVTFPGVTGTRLDLKGEIGSATIFGSTSTNPGTVPINTTAAMALIAADYPSLSSSTALGWSLSATPTSGGGGGGSGNVCSSGTYSPYTVCCDTGDDGQVQQTVDACNADQAIGEMNGSDGQYPGLDCWIGECASTKGQAKRQ